MYIMEFNQITTVEVARNYSYGQIQSTCSVEFRVEPDHNHIGGQKLQLWSNTEHM